MQSNAQRISFFSYCSCEYSHLSGKIIAILVNFLSTDANLLGTINYDFL